MADITLGDYAGYIFTELVKARQTADLYSKQVAEEYRSDEILKYFSVPRFRIPKMTVTVPLMISGARFRQVVEFRMTREEFTASVDGLMKDVIRKLRLRGVTIFRPPVIGGGRLGQPEPARAGGETGALIDELYTSLVENQDPTRPDSLVSVAWVDIFQAGIRQAGLADRYERDDPKHELLTESTNSIVATVKQNTVISKTTIDSLLVNPETQTVKDASSDKTVFTLAADVSEEAFYVRRMRDDESGATYDVVEFE